MSEHKATINWERNGADFGYKNYSRDHVWRFENGVETPASAAPAYLGNPQRVDPESAFVAALSSCHMLTFLALASNKGFVVDNSSQGFWKTAARQCIKEGRPKSFKPAAAPAASCSANSASLT
jgi:organic hydroperoxide reductase OsmC/OhrA